MSVSETNYTLKDYLKVILILLLTVVSLIVYYLLFIPWFSTILSSLDIPWSIFILNLATVLPILSLSTYYFLFRGIIN